MSTIPDVVKRWLRSDAASPSPAGDSRAPALRHSNGLHEFFHQLEGRRALHVLDLGPASQANINLITGLGHRIYHEDLYPELATYLYRVRVEGGGTRWDEGAFLRHNLNYPEELFDGVFCWDFLDLLPEPAAAAGIVDRLHQITKPRAAMLVFFHTADPGRDVPVCQCQIRANDSLQMLPRGQFVLKRPLNNRNIERLFRAFHSLKFFLARDGLREVLVVR